MRTEHVLCIDNLWMGTPELKGVFAPAGERDSWIPDKLLINLWHQRNA